jgi:hypothetical protein
LLFKFHFLCFIWYWIVSMTIISFFPHSLWVLIDYMKMLVLLWKLLSFTFEIYILVCHINFLYLLLRDLPRI